MADELWTVLQSLVGFFDDDEPVDEYAHALQSASRAIEAGARTSVVAAALFHDVARSPLIGPAYPGAAHEMVAATWLLPRFGEEVAWLAGAHVAAKLYLLANEPGYAARLSDASARSAVRQGGQPLDAALVRHPWWPDALALRRFDDAAKDPAASLPDPAEVLDLIRGLLLG